MLTPSIKDPNYANEKIRRAAQPHTFSPQSNPTQVKANPTAEEIAAQKHDQDVVDATADLQEADKALIDAKLAVISGAEKSVKKDVMGKLKTAQAKAEDELAEAQLALEELTA